MVQKPLNVHICSPKAFILFMASKETMNKLVAALALISLCTCAFAVDAKTVQKVVKVQAVSANAGPEIAAMAAVKEAKDEFNRSFKHSPTPPPLPGTLSAKEEFMNRSSESDEAILSLVKVRAQVKSAGVDSPEPVEAALRSKLARVDPVFKRKVMVIAVNGSQKQKDLMFARLDRLATQRDVTMGQTLYTRIKQKTLNHTLIRMMLATNSGLGEILNATT